MNASQERLSSSYKILTRGNDKNTRCTSGVKEEKLKNLAQKEVDVLRAQNRITKSGNE